jgi:uncharacterized protein (TIRG00374 family)
MKRYRNQMFIGILLALALYIGILLLADTSGELQSSDIMRHVTAFPVLLVIPVILAQIMVIVCRFVEWQYYLGVIEARDKISLRDSLVIFVSAFTMVVSPGKAAEFLKAVLLKVKTGVPVAQSAPIVLAERIVDGLAVIILMAVTLLLFGDDLNLRPYDGIDYASLSRLIVYSSAILIVTGLIVVQIRPLSYFVLNLIRRIPMVGRLYQPLLEFYESSREIFRLRHVIPMMCVGVGVYLFSVIGFLIILIGFGIELDGRTIIQATFITGAVSAVGALSFVPNGAGVTEISNTGMLLALMAPYHDGLTPAVAAAAALLQGFFHKWFRVLVGIVVAFVYRDSLFSVEVEQAVNEQQMQHQAPSDHH